MKIEFTRTVTRAENYAPNISAEPTPILSHDGPLAVDVGAQVVIVKVALGKSARGRVRLWLARRTVPAGGRLAVRGRVPRQVTGRSLPVKIQRWNKGWRTVGRSRTSRSGIFRKKIRVPARDGARASRLRVIARAAKPSRSVRVRIR